MTQSEESITRMTSYHFPPTVTDPSHSLRMTFNISLTTTNKSFADVSYDT